MKRTEKFGALMMMLILYTILTPSMETVPVPCQYSRMALLHGRGAKESLFRTIVISIDRPEMASRGPGLPWRTMISKSCGCRYTSIRHNFFLNPLMTPCWAWLWPRGTSTLKDGYRDWDSVASKQDWKNSCEIGRHFSILIERPLTYFGKMTLRHPFPHHACVAKSPSAPVLPA